MSQQHQRQKQTQTRRSVRFGEITEVILPENDLTEEEREQCFYSAVDVVNFRLDHNDNATNKSRRRYHYVRYILHLQAQNRSLCIHDPLGLRACAVAESKSAMERALISGTKTAAEVLQDETNSSSNMNETNSSSNSTGEQQRSDDVASRETEDTSSFNKCPQFKRGQPATINRPRKNKTTATLA